jgi:hypothetical protein
MSSIRYLHEHPVDGFRRNAEAVADGLPTSAVPESGISVWNICRYTAVISDIPLKHFTLDRLFAISR